jgi:hypothetical protein
MSATCPRPGLTQVCDGSATGLVADFGSETWVCDKALVVWSVSFWSRRVALVEFGLWLNIFRYCCSCVAALQVSYTARLSFICPYVVFQFHHSLDLIRLVYGNGELIGLTIHTKQRVQVVINADDWLVHRFHRFEHTADSCADEIRWLQLQNESNYSLHRLNFRIILLSTHYTI